MSYKIINKTATVGTTTVDVYTNTADACILVGLSLSNNTTGNVFVTVELYSSNSSTSFDIIAPDSLIVVGETLNPIGEVQKIVLNKNDILKVTCSVASGVDVIASAMELNDYL